MKKILFLLMFGCIAASGCTIHQHVEPAELSDDAELCIVENRAVREGFLLEFQRVLDEKGVRYKVVDQWYADKNCEWSATYVAHWLWDIALYMAYAEIKVYHNGELDGEAIYDSRQGGGNFSKFIDAEPKIRELVEELLQDK